MTMLLDRPLETIQETPTPQPVPPEPLTPEERFATRAFDGVLLVIGRDSEPFIMWDRDKPNEIAHACEVFAQVKGTGALLYRTDAGDTNDGVREQIREFDETAEQIVTVPRFVGG